MRQGGGTEAQDVLGGAGAGTGRYLCSFTHPSPPRSSPETSDFAFTSIGDDEPWRPGPGRGGSKRGCCSCQAISQAYSFAQDMVLADSTPTSAVMCQDGNSTNWLASGKLGGAGAGGGVKPLHVPPAGIWRVGLGSNTPSSHIHRSPLPERRLGFVDPLRGCDIAPSHLIGCTFVQMG